MFFWLTIMFGLNLMNVESARILAVFPSTARSHQNVFHPIIEGLVKRGHYVVFITTMSSYPDGNSPDNLKEINLQEVSFAGWQEELEKAAEGSSNNFLSQMKVGSYINERILMRQFNCKEVKNIIDDEQTQFDLLLTESYVWIALMLSHRFKVPLIQISSMGFIYGYYQPIGAPEQLFLYPQSLLRRYNNLTLIEKYYELYCDLTIRYMLTTQEDRDNVIVKTFYVDAPDLHFLKNNIHMLMLNAHTIWEANRPVPLSVVFIYGVHQKLLKNLPKDLQSYLDESSCGVIYISFGSNVKPSLLPFEKIEIMLTVLSQLPYNVLLKWDADEIPGRPKNVRIGKWFPQADLLKHPNIKAFITQAGLQSTDEAIAAGVPLIGIPILFDQFMNTEKYVRHGIGVKLNMETLTSEEFRLAVTTVIENESYRKNIIKLRDIYYDQPMQPMNRTIWWMEYVLRHNGAQHLRAPAANMSWAEFFEVELLFSAITIIIFMLIAIYFIMRTIFNYFLHKCMQTIMRIKQK